MADLVLGPMLRHVDETAATVWVETDAPCEVSVLGSGSRTFCVEGRHYGLLEVTGLAPGQVVEYTVELDGREAWPAPDSGLPSSSIHTLEPERELRIVFGSCRVSLPHEPPWVLHQAEHEHAQGIDALRALALRMAGAPRETWPDCVLMLGDQVYADDLSPAMREATASRRDPIGVPAGELGDFEEYALAYHEAWGEPVIRWLLSTVSTAMVFDDHEVHAQWKISQAWLDEMRAKPWYDGHITAALTAYWVYQHIGNLSLHELRGHELLDRVRRERDAGPLLREEMKRADRQPGHSRWSFSRDFGHTRLIVVDSRAGRDVTPGRRQMIDGGEWDWVVERATTGDAEHLLLASSVPIFLTPGLHYVEAWDEAVADGAWGPVAARVAERIRQTGVMDHWASFHRSFHRLGGLLRDLATGRHGPPPASIVMLSGDVHHCYLAEIGFRPGAGARSAVWQAVCSAYRKDLAPKEKAAMKLGNGRVGELLARGLARTAGVVRPSDFDWRLIHHPSYDNQVATLELKPGHAHVCVETTAGADWREPALSTVFEHQLAGRPALHE